MVSRRAVLPQEASKIRAQAGIHKFRRGRINRVQAALPLRQERTEGKRSLIKAESESEAKAEAKVGASSGFVVRLQGKLYGSILNNLGPGRWRVGLGLASGMAGLDECRLQTRMTIGEREMGRRINSIIDLRSWLASTGLPRLACLDLDWLSRPRAQNGYTRTLQHSEHTTALPRCHRPRSRVRGPRTRSPGRAPLGYAVSFAWRVDHAATPVTRINMPRFRLDACRSACHLTTYLPYHTTPQTVRSILSHWGQSQRGGSQFPSHHLADGVLIDRPEVGWRRSLGT